MKDPGRNCSDGGADDQAQKINARRRHKEGHSKNIVKIRLKQQQRKKPELTAFRSLAAISLASFSLNVASPRPDLAGLRPGSPSPPPSSLGLSPGSPGPCRLEPRTDHRPGFHGGSTDAATASARSWAPDDEPGILVVRTCSVDIFCLDLKRETAAPHPNAFATWNSR